MCHLLLQHGESFSCGMWDLYLQHAGSLLLVYGIFCQGMHDLCCDMWHVSCGMWDPSLWHEGSFICSVLFHCCGMQVPLVVSLQDVCCGTWNLWCGIFVAAGGIFVSACEIISCGIPAYLYFAHSVRSFSRGMWDLVVPCKIF